MQFLKNIEISDKIRRQQFSYYWFEQIIKVIQRQHNKSYIKQQMITNKPSFKLVFQRFQEQMEQWQQLSNIRSSTKSSSQSARRSCQIADYVLVSNQDDKESQQFDQVHSLIRASIQAEGVDTNQQDEYSQLERFYFGRQILLRSKIVAKKQINQNPPHQEMKLPGKYNDGGLEAELDGYETSTQNYQPDQIQDAEFIEHTAIFLRMLQ